MFRNLFGGAAVVLAVGILAVGCSDDGDTVVIGSDGELANSDQFPASSIASNNLAPDGGGMSPNNGNVAGVRVIYCCDSCGSDGDSSGASNDALILFTYTDGGGIVHLYATHFDGSSFTPPTRLRAPDRDETTGINTAAFSVVCLNTTGYSATVAADGQAVLQNAGAWVIIGDYTTFFNDPRLATSASTSGVEGVHRALAQWVFIPSLRGSGVTTSDRVGATARTFENGFMTTGIQLEVARSGAGPTVTTNIPGQTADGTYAAGAMQATNVQSYGLVSDAFCGQTCYMGSGAPATAATNTDWVRANPVSGAPTAAAFTLGERTSHVGLFYTQIVNSITGGGSFSQFGVGHGGNDVDLTFHSLDMRTLTFEAGITMNPPAAHNQESDTIQQSGTAWFPNFYGYNQYMFIKYLDMSLNQNIGGIVNTDRLSSLPGGAAYGYNNTGGHNGGTLHATSYYEEVIAGFCLVDDGDGTCSPGSFLGSTAGGADAGHDLSNTGTTAGGNHAIAVPTVVNSVLLNAPKREMSNFNRAFQFVFGPDEGLGDIVIFWVSADNTNTGSAATAATGDDTNFQKAIMACNIQEQAAGGTTYTTSGEPRRISVHQGDDFHQAVLNSTASLITTTRTDLNDPIVRQGSGNWFRPCINRTGTWISLIWTQDLGTSTDFRQALNGLVYQTFRPVSGTTGGTPPTSGVDFGTRFTAPAEISDQLPITLINFPTTQSRLNNGDTRQVWNSLPVNAYTWQGKAGYRCGIQSNENILTVAWEQSDATEDRVFMKAITVTPTSGGTPSFTISTAGELGGTPSVQGYRNFNDDVGTNAQTIAGATSTFRWLDGEVNAGTLNFCDLGVDSGGVGGGVLVVYSKIVDATTSDNDYADRRVFATRFVNGTLDATPLEIGVAVDEQAAIPAIGPNAGSVGLHVVDDAVNGASGSASTNRGNLFVTDAGTVGGCTLVCVPNNSSIETNPSYSADAIYIYFYGPSATNGSGSRALYTRKFDANIRENATLASANPNLGDRLIPTAGTGPGSTGHLPPTRLDHQDNQVTTVSCCQNGSSVLVMFMQDNHAWAQTTANGETYLVLNGAPNPALVDNDTSEDLINYTLTCCPPDGDANAFIVTLTKLDSDNDIRLRLRAGSGF